MSSQITLCAWLVLDQLPRLVPKNDKLTSRTLTFEDVGYIWNRVEARERFQRTKTLAILDLKLSENWSDAIERWYSVMVETQLLRNRNFE